jgi:FtsP/CotA-like multicopper oxidase with cupredoxin domain
MPRAPERDRGGRPRLSDVVWLSLVLAVGVVGWEYLVHVGSGADHHGGVGGLAHGMRDIVISLPMAVIAAYLGLWAACRLGMAGSGLGRTLNRAAIVSLVFAMLLVPSVGVHHAIDTYLDGAGAAAAAAPDAVAGAAPTLEQDTSVRGLAVHGVRDALIAVGAALPLTLLVLVLLGRATGRRREREPILLSLRGGRLRWGYLAVGATTIGYAFAGQLAGAQSIVQTAGAASTVTATAVNPCPKAPQRTYNVSAINVKMTLNRFGTNDPDAFMYVLDQNIQAVRDQEASGQVSIGLGNDPIQPLVIRANLGDCVTINFTNRTTFGLGPENPPPPDDPDDPCKPNTVCDGLIPHTAPVPLSLHIHGVSYLSDSAGSEVGNNPNTFVDPGATRSYTVFMDPALGEGAHVFHSHGDSREENGHGLFGTLIGEPAGSQWLDPSALQPLASGWDAVIKPTSGPSFREFALIYHEIGDEGFRGIMEKDGVTKLPVVDPFTEAYRPCSKAINYRSECFFERLTNLQNNGFLADESQQYGSYMNGDMATPQPRGYLGDPHKTRLVNAGAEMAHVHHHHGGAIRWRRNPGSDNPDIAGGLEKTPVQNATSTRLDSQTIQPGESYDLEHECGMGGCQQAAGDYLFHCHIAMHYISGMLGFFRVFDTLQPNLATLPARTARPQGVNSAGLIGLTIEGKTVVPQSQFTDPSTQVALETLVESQLPPQGVRLDPQDSTVWDWVKGGTSSAPVYFGEPEDTHVWPNFASSTPGQRPEILFDPGNGRYAWPLLRPHLGQRPPFSANGHTGAPWLGNTVTSTRPDGLCPSGAPVRTYNITAIQVTLNESKGGLTPAMVDPNGQILVLNEDKNAVLNGTRPTDPLAVRSNVGDCVAVTLTSQLNDTAENRNHSKVNLHTHFVQFDPQASDGVITGLSFEQSVRPAQSENRTLAAAAAAGATQITVSSTARLRTGITIEVGQGEADTEIAKITAISGSTLTLAQPLANAHASGEPAGVEFVQYRWYSDVDSGTVFFHDHVDGIHSWGHGLFAAHIIEPTGSTYHDPATGAEIRSGPIADIFTNGSVGSGQSGSFREYMLWLHNGLRGSGGPQGCEMGSFNMKAAPFIERDPNATLFNLGFTSLTEPAGADRKDCTNVGTSNDPYVFSSVAHGDPGTPLLRAYAGDPVVIRTIGLVERVGSLRVTGHRFAAERFNANGTLTDAGTTGISERFDYVLDGGAGGPRHLPGDYLYYSSRSMELESGAWGIFRVHDHKMSDLEVLPGRTAPPTGPGFPQLTFTGKAPPAATGPGNACPSTAPVRSYDVSIFQANEPNGVKQIMYSLTADEKDFMTNNRPPIPLVIRANQGECLKVNFTNDLPKDAFTWTWGSDGTRAGFSVGNILFDPQGSYGAAIGFDPDSTVAEGASRTYNFFVDKEVGTCLMLNLANESTMIPGAYGAVIAEPAGASYTDPVTGQAIRAGLAADIHTPRTLLSPAIKFREFVTLFTDAEPNLGHSIMDYDVDAEAATVDLTNDSLADREAGGTPIWKVFSSTFAGHDPATPTFKALAGDPVRFRVGVPAGHQPISFALEGHAFPLDHGIAKSMVIDARTLLPGQTFDVHVVNGAGGALKAPGDYLYLDHRLPFLQAGLWGLFRVLPTRDTSIKPL